MNRFLLAALTFAVAGSAATAQQISQPETPSAPLFEPPAAVSAPAEESGYAWYSLHYHRYELDENNEIVLDSNIRDIQLPVSYNSGAITIRGVGNLFAPKYFYTLFNGSVYNGTSNIYFDGTGPDGITDQDYIDQFKGAGGFTIDSVNFSMFENPSNVGTETQVPTVFNVYKVTENLASSSFRTNGLVKPHAGLEVVGSHEFSTQDIDATISDNRIVRTSVLFDPPLLFNDGESAVLMYENPEAAAVPNTDVTEGNTNEYQSMRGVIELMPGGTAMPSYKTMSVLLVQEAAGKTVVSTWRLLSYGQAPNQQPAILDMDIRVFGVVDLTSGVRYHFGTEVGGQGVGNVSPNPVVADTRIPFSLTERSNVTLDLFNSGGQHVRTLATGSYIPGQYSVPVTVGDLENGVYLVRMTAGTKVYTQKIVVSK